MFHSRFPIPHFPIARIVTFSASPMSQAWEYFAPDSGKKQKW